MKFFPALILVPAFLAAGETAEKAFLAGKKQLEAKKYTVAFYSFEAALKDDPKHLGALRGAGDCKALQGDRAAAVAFYERRLALPPDDPALRKYLALIRSQTLQWISPEELENIKAKDSRPILYDFTAAWCPPCRRLRKEVFEDPECAAWINGHFIPVEVMDRKKEEGSNSLRVRDLQQQVRLVGFPTLAVDLRQGGKLESYLDYFFKEMTMSWLRKQAAKRKP